MDHWLHKRFEPRSGTPGHQRDLPLEGLRGLCALAVLYAHIFIPAPTLDPVFAPSLQFYWFDFGEAAVVFFFVLSGYVIGLTTQSAASALSIGAYLSRRGLRLVPINTVAILLSWLLLPSLGLKLVLGNLGFLENNHARFFHWFLPTLPNNGALWSLNYEVLYYLLFIAVWYFAPRVFTVVLSLFAVIGLSLGVPNFPLFIGSYACGGLFWLAGLSVAWFCPKAPATGAWPSALLVLFATWNLAPLKEICARWYRPGLWPVPTSPHRLDFLPVCLWLLMATTGRGETAQKRLSAFCVPWAAVGLFFGVKNNIAGDSVLMWLCAAALVAAVVLLRYKPAGRILAWFAPVGLVSFALYVVASPLQSALRGAVFLPNGTVGAFAFRAVLLACASLGLAFLLERRFQPWLKARLSPRKRAS